MWLLRVEVHPFTDTLKATLVVGWDRGSHFATVFKAVRWLINEASSHQQLKVMGEGW